MRKQYSRRSSSAAAGETEHNFWSSYADMMSSFALILFFLMLLAYLSNIKTGINLKQTEKQLADTLSSLVVAQMEYDEANENLIRTQNDLELKEEELASKNEELASKEAELAGKQSELAEKEGNLLTIQIELDDANAELANQTLILAQQKETIDAQAQYVKDAKAELEVMRGQIEMIVGVREKILSQIKDGIESAGDKGSKVMIADNGSMVLSDAVFFDTGSSHLKQEAMPVLDQLVAVFTQLLSDQESLKYVDSIVIAGHTDSVGSDEFNRALSTNRANSVLRYILTDPVLNEHADLFCAAGYGYSRPIADNDTEEGRAKNRRIEVSVALKDETVVGIVNEYLQMEVPG